MPYSCNYISLNKTNLFLKVSQAGQQLFLNRLKNFGTLHGVMVTTHIVLTTGIFQRKCR